MKVLIFLTLLVSKVLADFSFLSFSNFPPEADNIASAYNMNIGSNYRPLNHL